MIKNIYKKKNKKKNKFNQHLPLQDPTKVSLKLYFWIEKLTIWQPWSWENFLLFKITLHLHNKPQILATSREEFAEISMSNFFG
jgi:hypothetical protein